MARNREFDVDEALEAALECFKQHGYHAASLSTLTADMGIGRASLYATFGDKRELFLSALRSYTNSTVGYFRERLAGADHPLEEIRSILSDVAKEAAAEDGRHGCLLSNTAVELGAADTDIGGHVAASLGRLEDSYCEALERAQRTGDLGAEKNPRAIARFLVATVHGIRVSGKASPDPRALADIAETAASVLQNSGAGEDRTIVPSR